jgi:Protein of unknown function (DUF1553)/Protein of unknown function (DUF1549)/Planctomycete cytochrome C/Concanavalin A-like lectin/glucanases superfamily
MEVSDRAGQSAIRRSTARRGLGTGFLSAYGLAVCLLVYAGPKGQAGGPSSTDIEFFEKDVRPLLIEKCGGCHGDVRPKGKLKLTSREAILAGGDNGPAAVPGKPDESLLVKAVRYHDDPRMPPKGKLADKHIEILERWVKLGLPWPGNKATPPATPADGRFSVTNQQRQFWSFRPVKAGSAPAVHDTAWPRTSVDPFILAKLEAAGLAPAGPADKRTLIRRATFDLIGLPPTPTEVDTFVADNSPEAFARVVDRLLASPRYGERWGRHWLDVVRYADARDLIQLPPESDFREAWRYRDWVVDSFNRDLPYPDFVRAQVAGDLLPSPRPGGFNADGLVATGLLAIADFVPGDVDKNQMIADYVNDQVDVVGRAFLGLSVACARCHDHKFDPISTEDYYALAGIFFSTRIVPGPVAGNTPLVRVPLLSPTEIAQRQAQDAAAARRRTELEQLLPEAADRAYREHLTGLLTGQSARYLVVAREVRKPVDTKNAVLADVAKRTGLHEGTLAEWVAFLDRVEKNPTANYPTAARELAAGNLTGTELAKAATVFQEMFATQAKRDAAEPEKNALARAALLSFRADDPRLATDAAGRVTLWPNRAGFSGDAAPSAPHTGPLKAATKVADHTKPVIRFDGQSLLEARRPVPAVGTLFVVYQTAPESAGGERLVGWEDADVGRHGLGLMLNRDGSRHAILRNNGQSGDVLDRSKPQGLESVCLTWGPGGTSMRRNGVETAGQTKIASLSSDPNITALKIGGPGSGGSPRFHGDVAELRVYSRPLTGAEVKQVEAELREAWYQPDDPKKLALDPLAELYAEVLSPRGPFWPPEAERTRRLSPEVQGQLQAMRVELDGLRARRPAEIPQAVVAQDGGPKGTRHEGFKDAPVFIRGDHKRPGKTVPRGFPRVLTGERAEAITTGSGRLQLGDWLARPDNPLPARVMVNRIWQHHFGEGLVRTPNDFGERGELPTHPELLDDLAARFVASGWSVKAMHRLLMLSAAYQQSSRPTAVALARDPENRLFGRTNRQRLDAEAIRDSLLAVAGRLDGGRGGPPFTDLGVPRRTLYLMAARTGANTSDFGRLFDRADPSLIVGQRGQSVVAPQALFFLNDPFVSGMAKFLAARIRAEGPSSVEARIRRLYALVLGRPPTPDEVDVGSQLLFRSESNGPDPWERYCLLVLSTNEFLYVD